MTVKELRAILFNMPDDAKIVVGCQGYASDYCEEESEVRATLSGGSVYLTDYTHYDQLDN